MIPFDKPSRHRKVRLDDLLEYRRLQRSQAELALADMVADAERLGLYDTDPTEVKAALKAARQRQEPTRRVQRAARHLRPRAQPSP